MDGINFSGFNGIDFGLIIDSIIKQESQPLENTQKQQKSLQDKDSALTQLGSQISDLQSVVKDLIRGGIFSGVSATSSDTTVLRASKAGSDAVAGHYDIEITRLAKAQVTASGNGYSKTTDTAADGGSISFTVNGETTDPIEITGATTLAGLKDLINNQNSGVVASIVNTGNSNKLVITGRQTGVANGFVINNSLTNSGGNAVEFQVGQNATTGNAQNAVDALVAVNGLTIESASNTVTGAIPGVSINLVHTGSASLDLASDSDSLKTSVKSFVSLYNKLRDFYSKQSGKDSDGNRMPLATDSVMRQVLADLRKTLLGTNENGGIYKHLSDVGIELSSDGSMKFDESKFDDALSAHRDDLKKLIQGGTGVDGVFKLMKSRLEALDSTAGLIKTSQNGLEANIKRYQTMIEQQQLRLDVRRKELTKIYSAADEAMSRLNQLSSSLSAIGR